MRLARLRRLALALPFALAALAAAPPADAFCGFYVGSADRKLFNNATQVALMREGTRTVLSMQNNYQGPPENFAMVVPVPVVLQKENVKTLPDAVFDHLDQLAAPRLVEYWEQDPCMQMQAVAEGAMAAPMAAAPAGAARGGGADLGVKIEAQFEVGEYEVVILSARDSLGLDTWLRQNDYKIPEGAEPILKPYVEGGMKFFVAKVNIEKVAMKDGMAMLSPLRFHYDTESFNLPVRLGLLNSSGKQDLIVHILARGQRYELANYKNVTIPTNLDVAENARDQFGAFYAALFDRTIEENPGAIVTEYSWDANSCDPCPTPPLSPQDLSTLGADVLPGAEPAPDAAPAPVPAPRRTKTKSPPASPGAAAPPAQPAQPAPLPSPSFGGWQGGFVLTRLHARYGKDNLGEDLVFRAAPPIMGGREFPGDNGKLEVGSRTSGVNNFQARYAVRHGWTGAIACDNPRRGVWGGPPGGGGESKTRVAEDVAFAPRGGVKLASFVQHDVPEINLKAASATVTHPGEAPGAKPDVPTKPSAPHATRPTENPGARPPGPGAAPPGACHCSTPGAGAQRGPAGAALAALATLAAAIIGRRRGTA